MSEETSLAHETQGQDQPVISQDTPGLSQDQPIKSQDQPGPGQEPSLTQFTQSVLWSVLLNAPLSPAGLL